jgi:hypothetical protein
MEENPRNCKHGNHQSLLHIAYDFLVHLKGGGKSIHIMEEERLNKLTVWLQEFIPPPICFLTEWIV